jgi:hypothetical protein
VEVPAVTLEEVVEKRGFDRCALICDIEGSEIHLIHAEIEVFRSRVYMFIVEFHPKINGREAVEEARRFLGANGFEQVWERDQVYVFRNAAQVRAS